MDGLLWFAACEFQELDVLGMSFWNHDLASRSAKLRYATPRFRAEAAIHCPKKNRHCFLVVSRPWFFVAGKSNFHRSLGHGLQMLAGRPTHEATESGAKVSYSIDLDLFP